MGCGAGCANESLDVVSFHHFFIVHIISHGRGDNRIAEAGEVSPLSNRESIRGQRRVKGNQCI